MAERSDSDEVLPEPSEHTTGALPTDLARQFDDLDVDGIENEERAAARRNSTIEAGRRKGGIAGAAMAGAMVAIGEIYEGPKKDDAPIEIEASGEPGDIDEDGIEVTVDDVNVWAPPPGDR